MIKADSLTRFYGDLAAVQGVSFEIGHGEIVGLLGHNGAGKTTIMKMITGCLEPSSGTVTINGINVWSSRLAVQQQVGYLPENCPLYSEMTVLDYLDYASAIKGVAPADRIKRIADSIAKTNLAAVAHQRIGTLSRGYKQRLGVAQAIINGPGILILDEPTNGLDPSQIIEMRSLIRELAQSATIVISTHILQEVQAVCGRVIIINAGRVALDSDIDKLRFTRCLEVVTDASPDDCARFLAGVNGLQALKWEERGAMFKYLLDSSACELPESAPVVARALVHHGANVFAIQPVVRDLETVFAEITSGTTMSVESDGPGKDLTGQEHSGKMVFTPPPVAKAPLTTGKDDARQGEEVANG